MYPVIPGFTGIQTTFYFLLLLTFTNIVYYFYYLLHYRYSTVLRGVLVRVLKENVHHAPLTFLLCQTQPKNESWQYLALNWWVLSICLLGWWVAWPNPLAWMVLSFPFPPLPLLLWCSGWVCCFCLCQKYLCPMVGVGVQFLGWTPHLACWRYPFHPFGRHENGLRTLPHWQKNMFLFLHGVRLWRRLQTYFCPVKKRKNRNVQSQAPRHRKTTQQTIRSASKLTG